MPDFRVDFECLVPEWYSMNIQGADDADDAEAQAWDQIPMIYPEATEIVVTDVVEIAQ